MTTVAQVVSLSVTRSCTIHSDNFLPHTKLTAQSKMCVEVFLSTMNAFYLVNQVGKGCQVCFRTHAQ